MAMEFNSELVRLEVESVEKKGHDCFQRTQDMRWLDSHTEDGGMLRCLANIREEAAREKEFQERTDHAALVNERARKESALCFEVNKIREEKLSEEYRRQQLRDNDPELQELMRKLRAAYVCRDQRQQILHNEYKKLQERHEELQADQRLQEALFSEKQDRERQEALEAQRREQYCAALQQQIVNTHRRRQCLYEDTLVEKKMLDDVIRKVYEEDMRELQLKKEKVERTRRDQQLHREAQLAWRDRHARRLCREERRLQRHAAGTGTADRDAAVVAERKRRLDLKEAISKRIGAVILEEEAKKAERNNIIMSLQEQEYIEKNLNDALVEKEKLTRTKREIQSSLIAQMQMRKEQAASEREQDRRYREDMEKQMREEEEKEQQKEQRQRQRRRNYSLELQQQLQSRHGRHGQRGGGHQSDHRVRDYDADRQRQVAAEREKLIEEHVPHLSGCLPPGTLSVRETELAAGCLPPGTLSVRETELAAGCLPPGTLSVRETELAAGCLPPGTLSVRETELALSAARRQSAALDIEAEGETRAPRTFAKCNEQCRTLRRY